MHTDAETYKQLPLAITAGIRALRINYDIEVKLVVESWIDRIDSLFDEKECSDFRKLHNKAKTYRQQLKEVKR